MNSSPECKAQALMTLEGISQSYRIGERVIPILKNISLTLWRGDVRPSRSVRVGKEHAA